MRLSTRLAGAAAATLIVTGGLAGCSLPGTGGSSDGDRPAGATAGDPVQGGAATFDKADKPVVKGTFDSPIAPGAKVDIAIVGLKVRGKLATLTMQFTPHVPPGGESDPSPYELNGEKGLGTSLIDPVNLKRYVVVQDSSTRLLETDDVTTNIANNQTANLTATFAAPPENVKTVDVQIGAWPTFRNIPVER